MKRLLFATGMLTIALVGQAQAAAAHWDRFSCYAYVHEQCYGGGQTNCDSETYNWGLDQCDGYYPSAAIKRPTGLKGTPSKQTLDLARTTIQRSFR